ncbi:hypothetical protein [Nocardioides sp. GY 10127]|uniref:hypothetical protein n=1 Tax=Nocardioides sp. GY 10127 TaxID=2569762 RepID=UPI0010A79ACF|nr:hypothetical protein [Nocardioides sp. GY 10127]TIC85512.1 hypothetical protein E8D37_02440 [Nocardioides sp. GY 10127]
MPRHVDRTERSPGRLTPGPARLLASRRLRAGLGLGAVAMLFVTSTQAFWTDSVVVGGATIATGTLDLQADGADSVASFSDLSLSGLVPGSSTAAVLTLENNGTVPLAWTATSSGTNTDGKGLLTALEVDVTGASSVTGSGLAQTCSGSSLAGAATVLGGSLVSTKRTLAAGASETVCVEVTLPLTAALGLSGATTDVTLTFTGTSDLS